MGVLVLTPVISRRMSRLGSHSAAVLWRHALFQEGSQFVFQLLHILLLCHCLLDLRSVCHLCRPPVGISCMHLVSSIRALLIWP